MWKYNIVWITAQVCPCKVVLKIKSHLALQHQLFIRETSESYKLIECTKQTYANGNTLIAYRNIWKVSDENYKGLLLVLLTDEFDDKIQWLVKLPPVVIALSSDSVIKEFNKF